MRVRQGSGPEDEFWRLHRGKADATGWRGQLSPGDLRCEKV